MNKLRYGTWAGILIVSLSACAAPPAIYDVEDSNSQGAGSRQGRGAAAQMEEPPVELSVARNTVPWAQFEIVVDAARVMRSREAVLLQLDLIVSNLNSQVGYLDPTGWRVELQQGSGTSQTSRLDVTGNATQEMSVEFSLSTVPSDLEGAVLVMDAPKAGTLEPETVPLDTAWQPVYPLPIESLSGHRFLGMRTKVAQAEVADFDVLDARIDLNDVDEGDRAPLGKRYLRANFRATAVEVSFGDLVLQKTNFRLIIDGQKLAPLNRINERLELDETFDTHVLFEVPASARQAELTFATSDATISVPVELPEVPAL